MVVVLTARDITNGEDSYNYVLNTFHKKSDIHLLETCRIFDSRNAEIKKFLSSICALPINVDSYLTFKIFKKI